MPRMLEKQVYTFNELSESAKEKAREWFRSCDDFESDYILEDANNCAAILGIDISTRNQKPNIYFSGFSSQGDGACFEGEYNYKKGSAKAIRAHAPKDTDLHAIADGLQAVQRENFYSLSANVRHTGHYYHAHSTTIGVERFGEDASSEIENTVSELLCDFMDWIYARLECGYDYQNSDDTIDENIRANEYEFDEDGSIL